MTTSKSDIEKMGKQILYDLSVTRTRVDELVQAVASLAVVEDPPDGRPKCPHCGPLTSVKNEEQLREHLENVHQEGW